MSARRRAKVVPLCGQGAGCTTESLHVRGINLTLAEAIEDLTALHDARHESKGENWHVATGMLHLFVHRESERRKDDAEQRRARRRFFGRAQADGSSRCWIDV